MARKIGKKLADKLTKIACKQLETSTRFKQPRMTEIQASIDLYDNKVKPAGRGRFNVPVPVMAGFVDTLMSKTDEGVSLNFKYTNIANLIKKQKIQAVYEKESGPSRGNWDRVDRAVKKNAIFSGVFLYEEYAESDPEYKNHFRGIDYLDFHCEPMGGQDLEKHLFCGVEGVFKSKADLERLAEAEVYDANQVLSLLSRNGKEDRKRTQELFKNKMERYANRGLDPETNSYVGDDVYELTKWVIEHEGTKYYLVFDYFTQTWVRCIRLKDLNPSGRLPWVAAHTHSDLLNFWSKAPADDVRPIAEAMNILFNQALDNRQKRNFGMRAVDPEVFPDLSQLEWRPDGLVMANIGQSGKSISSGLYEFKTEEVGGTIDLISFMDNFLGQKSGVTADAQGESDEKRVGIYYGNLQQVADRIGLYNKSYSEAHAKIGLLFQEGVREHMTEGYMVRWIGEDGASYEGEVSPDDARVEGEGDGVEDFDIDAVGGQAEMRANDIKKASRKEALAAILTNQNLASRINPTWAIKQILETGEYDKDEISMALDVNSDGSIEQIARAAGVIQKILNGETPKKMRTADTTFVLKIMDYAVDEVEDMETFDKMMTYAEEHMQIALENMARKARKIVSQRQVAAPVEAGGGAPAPTGPVPGTPEGTLSRSMKAVDDAVPGSPASLPTGA